MLFSTLTGEQHNCTWTCSARGLRFASTFAIITLRLEFSLLMGKVYQESGRVISVSPSGREPRLFLCLALAGIELFLMIQDVSGAVQDCKKASSTRRSERRPGDAPSSWKGSQPSQLLGGTASTSLHVMFKGKRPTPKFTARRRL